MGRSKNPTRRKRENKKISAPEFKGRQNLLDGIHQRPPDLEELLESEQRPSRRSEDQPTKRAIGSSKPERGRPERITDETLQYQWKWCKSIYEDRWKKIKENPENPETWEYLLPLLFPACHKDAKERILSEITKFLESKKYRLTPENLANATAGLPWLGWKQSFKRLLLLKAAERRGLER